MDDYSATRVLVCHTEAFLYVCVVDERDLTREYFRFARFTGKGSGRAHHVDRDALPEVVSAYFADGMEAIGKEADARATEGSGNDR